MTWVGAPSPDLDGVLSLRADLHGLWRDLEAELYAAPGLDPVVLELCRIRVAQLVGAPGQLAHRREVAVAAGLDEELVAALPDWPRDARFDVLARAAIAVAETFVIDPHRLEDADTEAVRDLAGDRGLATLMTGLAVWEGICRFEKVMGVRP
jgi:alkylhydroperoxidase family enzyme